MENLRMQSGGDGAARAGDVSQAVSRFAGYPAVTQAIEKQFLSAVNDMASFVNSEDFAKAITPYRNNPGVARRIVECLLPTSGFTPDKTMVNILFGNGRIPEKIIMDRIALRLNEENTVNTVNSIKSPELAETLVEFIIKIIVRGDSETDDKAEILEEMAKRFEDDPDIANGLLSKFYKLCSIKIHLIDNAFDLNRLIGGPREVTKEDMISLLRNEEFAGMMKRHRNVPEARDMVLDTFYSYPDSLRVIIDILSIAGEDANAARAVSYLVPNLVRLQYNKEGLAYYKELIKNTINIPENLANIRITSDTAFLKMAYECMRFGSADFYRHEMACMLLRQHAENAKIKAVLKSSEGWEKIRNDVFEKSGILDMGLMSEKEKLVIMRSCLDMRLYSKEINKFLKNRMNGFEFSTSIGEYFRFEKINKNRLLGIVKTGGMESMQNQMPEEEACNYLFFGLACDDNGGIEAHRKAAAKLAVYAGENKVKMARKAFRWLRNNDPTGLMSLARAHSNRDFGAMKHEFAEIAKTMNNSAKESISDIIDIMDGATKGTLLRGKNLLAYVVRGKNNIINIGSNVTGCCTFLPNGIHQEAAFAYANDPGIVLVCFAFDDNPERARLEEIRVVGAAVSCLALGPNKEKVLYVDSLEGGITFTNAIAGREQKITEIISGFARSIGADKVAYYRTPLGRPRFFVDKIDAQTEKIKLRFLFEDGYKHYLDFDQRATNQWEYELLTKVVRL